MTYTEVLEEVRATVLDSQGRVFTDERLRPLLRAAERKVHDNLAVNGCNIAELTDIVTVPAGGTTISRTSSPALPADFMLPWFLMERRAGAPDDQFQDMLRDNAEKPIATSQFLGVWHWAGGAIHFPAAATQNLDIFIYYERETPEIADLGDELLVPGSGSCLVDYMVSRLSLSRGSAEIYGATRGEFRESLDELRGRNIKSQQWDYRRKAPYSTRIPAGLRLQR